MALGTGGALTELWWRWAQIRFTELVSRKSSPLYWQGGAGHIRTHAHMKARPAQVKH